MKGKKGRKEGRIKVYLGMCGRKERRSEAVGKVPVQEGKKCEWVRKDM